MFESESPTNYELVYRKLVKELSIKPLEKLVKQLGLSIEDDYIGIPFFSWRLKWTKEGLLPPWEGELDFKIRIVVAYYLKHCGKGEIEGKWVPYSTFEGGEVFASYFQQHVEGDIARFFEGKGEELLLKADKLGGENVRDIDVPGEIIIKFFPLPRVPLVLSFYDSDEEFPASVRIFFDKSARKFLDLECLAVLGTILLELLKDPNNIMRGD